MYKGLQCSCSRAAPGSTQAEEDLCSAAGPSGALPQPLAPDGLPSLSFSELMRSECCLLVTMPLTVVVAQNFLVFISVYIYVSQQKIASVFLRGYPENQYEI